MRTRLSRLSACMCLSVHACVHVCVRQGLDTSAAAKSVFSGGDESKKGQMGCEMVRGEPKMARVGQKDRHEEGKEERW